MFGQDKEKLIGQLLEKYQKLQPYGSDVEKVAAEILKDFKIDKLSFNKNTLHLQASALTKTVILKDKNKYIEEINQKLSKSKVKNIT